ncbi:MAG: FkbM family methyltransferase [Phycisphaeraceae bacterium]|nr:FkbM family methyltransferase [Phycisphaeraceae bacterium]
MLVKLLHALHAPLARTPIAGWIAPLQLSRRLRGWNDRIILRRGEHTLTMFDQSLRFKVTTRTQVIGIDDALSEKAFLQRLLDCVQAGDVVYDVGANLGIVSMLVARCTTDMDIRIDAFEPEPANFALLQANLAENHVASVHLHALALGEQDGAVMLHRHGEAGGGTHATTGRSGDAVAVPVARGQTIAQQTQAPPTVLKIDVEGAEWAVLRGFEPLLRQGTIRELLIEAHPRPLEARGESMAAMCDWLSALAYRVVWSRRRNMEWHLHLQRKETVR